VVGDRELLASVLVSSALEKLNKNPDCRVTLVENYDFF
jgi:hypothetical protein